MSIANPTADEIAAKEKTIKAEKRRLKQLLSNLPENKLKAAEGLIDECAFMRATLKQYREYINVVGMIDEMCQGDYSIIREHPAIRSYNTMVQKYAAVSRQLFDMLPIAAQPVGQEEERFEEYRKQK